jgi:hypothetical protein
MDARLVIYNPNGSAPTDIPISAEIPVAITLAIADIRDPDKRNSSFSKTLTLPGTKILNKLFEHIFDIPTNLSNFNPNLKTRCEYYVRSERVFEGDIQLLKIRKSGKPYSSIYYECSIVGRLANVFLDLGNTMLTDLDFSDLNHVFNYTNRNWTPTLGTGYTYPLIDYGVTGGCGYYWDFAHLSPAIFEREYIDRIFDSINKTYTSTYFASSYGKSIIIPRTNEGALKMTNSQVNGVSFYAGRTTDTSVQNIVLSNSGGGVWVTPSYPLPNGLSIVAFPDDSTSPFYDGGANYNTANSVFTLPITMETKASTLCNFKVRLNVPVGCNSYAYISMPQMNVDIIIPGIGNVTGSASFTFTLNSYVDVSVQVTAPNILIPSGTTVYVVASIDPSPLLFYNSGVINTTGPFSIDVYMTSTSWFSATSATGNLPIGYTVDMNQCVPKNVKQIDFLMSVIKSENLYMELDLTDSNNYIIEKRSDFFTANSTALDWTRKWDYQREIEIIPMGELDFKKYLFTYKTDGDKFNKLYKDAYGEVYATKYILVDNDFIKNEKKTELIFASTPMVGNAQTTLVYPLFAQVDGVNVKPMAVQIRRLYWGGVIQMPGGAFYGLINSTNGINPVTTSIYPFAGSVDNPYAPTLSLDWGIPQILYYQFPGQVWTNNNLYVRNYQRFIEQITNQNSKIVIMWIRLRPTDISNFSFRTPIFIDGSYYLVNKIYEYDPQKDEPVKVEFLRLAYVDAPITEDIEIWNNGEGSVSGINYGINVNPNGNNPNGLSAVSTGMSIGENNISNGLQSGVVGGEDNFIGGNNAGS